MIFVTYESGKLFANYGTRKEELGLGAWVYIENSEQDLYKYQLTESTVRGEYCLYHEQTGKFTSGFAKSYMILADESSPGVVRFKDRLQYARELQGFPVSLTDAIHLLASELEELDEALGKSGLSPEPEKTVDTVDSSATEELVGELVDVILSAKYVLQELHRDPDEEIIRKHRIFETRTYALENGQRIKFTSPLEDPPNVKKVCRP